MNFLKRRIVQGGGAILSNAYVQGFFSGALYQGPLKNGCTPLLNCYACPAAVLSCPIGTIQHFMAIRSVPFYAIGVLSVIGVSVGRMTCGVLCPFGALQDLLYKFRSWKISIPSGVRFFRWATLAILVLAIPFFTGEHWFSKLCPAGTLEAGLPWAVMDAGVRTLIGSLFWVKIAILLSVVALSTMAKRPFCRAICPLGAILSLFNRASFVQLAWNPETCTRCGKCRVICPADIRPDRKAADPECLRCLDCTACASLKSTTVFHDRPFAPAGAAETTTVLGD